MSTDYNKRTATASRSRRHIGMFLVAAIAFVLAFCIAPAQVFAGGDIIQTGTNHTKTTRGNGGAVDYTESTFAKGMKLTSVTIDIEKLSKTPRATIIDTMTISPLLLRHSIHRCYSVPR